MHFKVPKDWILKALMQGTGLRKPDDSKIIPVTQHGSKITAQTFSIKVNGLASSFGRLTLWIGKSSDWTQWQGREKSSQLEFR